MIHNSNFCTKNRTFLFDTRLWAILKLVDDCWVFWILMAFINVLQPIQISKMTNKMSTFLIYIFLKITKYSFTYQIQKLKTLYRFISLWGHKSCNVAGNRKYYLVEFVWLLLWKNTACTVCTVIRPATMRTRITPNTRRV